MPSKSSSSLTILNAHIVPIDGEAFDGGLVIKDGKISELGPKVKASRGSEVLDAAGQWLLPGFIDAHTHLGVHEEAEGAAGNDVNEVTDPVTAAVRALDGINPREMGFDDALSGGITTVNVNPGSANPIGGLAVALHTHGGYVDDMVLRNPSGLKSALGENPKNASAGKKHPQATRMGTALTIRKAFQEAQDYLALAAEDRKGHDLKLEALGLVLRGEIPWRQHAHRADDIATAIRIADEFGYQLVLDHGTEAHLLAPLLAEKGIPVLIGPLFTARSKVELRNRSLANPGKLAAAGVEISIITDHPVVPIHFLVHQATLAIKEGLDRQTALRSITINPAKVLGLADRIGSLSAGKDADLVLWSGDPLDVMQRATLVLIGGEPVYHYDQESRSGVVAPR